MWRGGRVNSGKSHLSRHTSLVELSRNVQQQAKTSLVELSRNVQQQAKRVRLDSIEIRNRNGNINISSLTPYPPPPNSVGGVTSSYSCDADGRRVTRLTGGVTTLFLYDLAGHLIAE